MNIFDYKKYISSETMMGPSSARILEALFDKYPLQLEPDDLILDLGCGKGLTSLIIAKETGAKVYANDLWISAEENEKRFDEWGVGGQIIPVCEDANHLNFEEKKFSALVSIDSYHYFAGNKGFFQEKILPFIKDDGIVLIGVPGLKDEYEGRAEELLSDWLGDEAYMFKSPKAWKELIGNDDRMESVTTWEMDCFDRAWSEWLAVDNKFAQGDKQHFETIIKPYTCFVGICVKIKRQPIHYKIRKIKETEYPLLKEFLYEAIFVPEGVEPPPRAIVDAPELQVYISGFGSEPHDIAFIAEIDNKAIGAVWVRIMNDYGHIDDQTPSFAISLYKEYRGHGIGTELMKKMLTILKTCGYERASLAVQKANYAVKMYRKLGFDIVGENKEEYMMVKHLQR